jgi:hypothetical protein
MKHGLSARQTDASNEHALTAQLGARTTASQLLIDLDPRGSGPRLKLTSDSLTAVLGSPGVAILIRQGVQGPQKAGVLIGWPLMSPRAVIASLLGSLAISCAGSLGPPLGPWRHAALQRRGAVAASDPGLLQRCSLRWFNQTLDHFSFVGGTQHCMPCA